MPPFSEVIDALTHAVLPAAGASAVVFALVAKFAPSRARVAAGALAVAAGFLAGNAFRGAIEFRIDFEQPLTAGQLTDALHATFAPPADTEVEGYVPPPSGWYWLPWTAGLALAAGLVARAVPPAAAWPVRGGAVIVAASLAVLPSPELRGVVAWFVPLLAAVMLGEWAILERLGRRDDEHRLRLLAPAAAALSCVAAAVVLLHAHTARLTDVAVILGSALAALAVVAWLLKSDPSACSPAAAVVLPALLLSGRQDTFSEVPPASFALVAAAPLTLGLLILPRLRTLRPRALAIAAAVLLLSPLAAGVALAMRAESLSFE